ncbi:MAG: response regulator [Acidocella sp.]|nr:response regulator [Acidocella sp.]MDR3683559.1 response regulator [Geothrix sp.]
MPVFEAGVWEMAEARPLVVVVNDDAAMRDALRFVLRLEGLEVQAYANGDAFLASRDLPHAKCLILKDRLPGLDAFELLRQLRARELSPPVILLTSAASPALYGRAQAAGVWRVLEKPILDNRLVEAVTSVLAGCHAAKPT